MKKKGIVMLMLAVILHVNVINVQAKTTYPSYTYNEWNESTPAPDSYVPFKVRNGWEMGSGALKEPKDFFMNKEGKLYISDTGNNRIVITDTNLNFLEEISTVLIEGQEEALTGPEGLFVAEDGTLYITQPPLGRILIVRGREVVQIIEKPDDPLIGADFIFSPIKVGVDIYGRIYVLSKGNYSGLMKFSETGEFIDFFGANKVEVTAKMLLDYTWKNLLSDEQRAAMASILPIEYSNIDCSDDGFIYTTTVGTRLPVNQIKKLNPLGNNTYFSRGKEEVNFGDLEIAYVKATAMPSSFIDVKVDKEGFIFGLDLTKGRIFERDQEGNLTAVFGGLGNQKGTFLTPAAIESYEDKVYVLDSMKHNVTIFMPTDYGTLIREAILLYTEGRYEESSVVWQEVSKRNVNSTIAHIGQGKALSQSKEYKAAMEAFQKGADRYDYSRAFMRYRLETIREYAPVFVIGVIVLAVVIKAKDVLKKKYKKGRDDNE